MWHAQARRRALPAAEAYALALEADRTRERQREIGYRLYWLSDALLGTRDVPASPGGHAVVGRHASCDVVLDDERAVSLRHVLVRAASLHDGFPVLSVLDLQTSTGFDLDDGTPQRSIGATGPIVFRIGAHSVVALPSSGRLPDALPVPVVARGELAPHRVAAVRIAAVRAEEQSSASEVSRITVLPRSVDLSHRSSILSMGAEASLARSIVEAQPSNGEAYEVVLATRGLRAGVRLTAADLEHGVLLGRSDKCVDEGLRATLGGTISRVHALLIRENGCCHLYDLASLVGTFEGERRVRCVPLCDDGTTVQLAGRGGVTLRWRALGALGAPGSPG
jgi:hypothetical protein